MALYRHRNFMTAYKNRKLDKSKPIEVYRNLHLPGRQYSIRQEGRVIGHTKAIMIRDAEFVVQQAAWKRYFLTGVRNVHAFVRGYFTDSGMGTTALESDLPRIQYRKDHGMFTHMCSDFSLHGAMVATLNQDGLRAAYTH
jgi:hypothetical protein